MVHKITSGKLVHQCMGVIGLQPLFVVLAFHRFLLLWETNGGEGSKMSRSIVCNSQSTINWRPCKANYIYVYFFFFFFFSSIIKICFFLARQIKKRRKRLGWRAVMLDEWLSKVQKMRRATSGQESVYIGCFAILVVVPNKDGGRKVMKDEMTRFFFFTTQPIKFLISLK